jgi:hypothetical protein
MKRYRGLDYKEQFKIFVSDLYGQPMEIKRGAPVYPLYRDGNTGHWVQVKPMVSVPIEPTVRNHPLTNIFK